MQTLVELYVLHKVRLLLCWLIFMFYPKKILVLIFQYQQGVPETI